MVPTMFAVGALLTKHQIQMAWAENDKKKLGRNTSCTGARARGSPRLAGRPAGELTSIEPTGARAVPNELRGTTVIQHVVK